MPSRSYDAMYLYSVSPCSSDGWSWNAAFHQFTYMSLLFRSTSNIHALELFQWQEILSSFWYPSTKNTSDKPWALKCENEFEMSLHLVLLGAISGYKNLFCFFLLWFLFPCSFFLIGCGKDFYWIGKCSMYTNTWFCFFTPVVYREPGCYQA